MKTAVARRAIASHSFAKEIEIHGHNAAARPGRPAKGGPAAGAPVDRMDDNPLGTEARKVPQGAIGPVRVADDPAVVLLDERGERRPKWCVERVITREPPKKARVFWRYTGACLEVVVGAAQE